MAKVYLVASGKGGTGKSSVTVLLGRSLAALGRNVLLLELDSGLRSLDMMLGVSDRVLFDAGDLLTGRCKPVDAVTVVPTSTGNLHYIAAPMDSSFVPDRDGLHKLVGGIGEYFDYIFIDAPAGLGGVVPLLSEAADHALVVTHAHPISVRDAASLVSLLRRNGHLGQRLIINSFSSRQISPSLPDLDWVIDTVGAQLIGIVPYDPALSPALAEGRPPPISSAAMSAFTAIAGRLEGQYLPLLASSLR